VIQWRIAHHPKLFIHTLANLFAAAPLLENYHELRVWAWHRRTSFPPTDWVTNYVYVSLIRVWSWHRWIYFSTLFAQISVVKTTVSFSSKGHVLFGLLALLAPKDSELISLLSLHKCRFSRLSFYFNSKGMYYSDFWRQMTAKWFFYCTDAIWTTVLFSYRDFDVCIQRAGNYLGVWRFWRQQRANWFFSFFIAQIPAIWTTVSFWYRDFDFRFPVLIEMFVTTISFLFFRLGPSNQWSSGPSRGWDW